MGDLIAWKAAEEVIKIITAENAMVAGMSIEEAAAALGYTLTKSGMYVKTVTDVASVAGAGATASEAIAGAAATGGAATTTANLTLYTTAEGATAVGGLGSIALPAAACCLAAAGGYAIGNVTGEMIDNAYPDFFDGLFCSVSKFLTGDERSLAFIFDKDGQAYLPQASQEAIDSYIQNQISNSSNFVNYNGTDIHFKTASAGDCFKFTYNEYWELSSLISASTVYSVAFSDGVAVTIYVFSKDPVTINFKVYSHYNFENLVLKYNDCLDCQNPCSEYNGKKWYGFGLKLGNIDEIVGYPLIIPTINKITQYSLHESIVGYILYGDFPSTVPKIDKVEVPRKPTIEVPSNYPSWVPVPLPSTYPSKLPIETPEPNSEPDPSIVTPYLPQPQPYPSDFPVVQPASEPDSNPVVVPTPQPSPQPTPSPDTDPSAEPVPNPNPAPEPTPTPKPDDTGETPTPILPVVPPISSEADGLLHVYNPTSAQINEFGRWLWTTFSGDLIDTIAKLFNNPMDAVIGLHELYCTPSTASTTTIKAGFLDSGVTSRLVDSRYTEINCGAITVPEYWGNYLDYSPYTKVYCYLPFIGIVELNTDDIVGHGVQITYKIDSYNGSCIAMITTAKKQDEESVVYQFSGNCSVEVPITSGMKSAMQSALIGAATCAIGAGTAGVAGSAVATAAVAGGAKRGLNSKNTVSHSGTFGSSYGAMGIKKPYIIVKRPVQKVVHGYNKNYGYPAHNMVTISNCSGYLRCRDFEVVSSTATEEEKKRIAILLKEGVYV